MPGGWDEIAADDPTLERPGCLRCRAVDAVGNQADWVRRRLRDRWLARGRAQDEAGMAENREAPRVQKSGPT